MGNKPKFTVRSPGCVQDDRMELTLQRPPAATNTRDTPSPGRRDGTGTLGRAEEPGVAAAGPGG